MSVLSPPLFLFYLESSQDIEFLIYISVIVYMSPPDPIDFVRCWFCHVGANEGGEIELVLFDRMGKGIIFWPV
jgi:hypothetical protein